MNTQRGFVGILGLVITIVVVAAGGYLYSQREVTLPEPIPEEQVDRTTTSGWQTYRNDEYGFEFEYPTDWVYEVMPSYDENANIVKEESVFYFTSPGLTRVIVSPLGQEFVGGTGGLGYSLTSAAYPKFHVAFLPLNAKPDLSPEEIREFETILSTFRFTGSEIDISSWQIFRGQFGVDNNSFSMKYPSGWQVKPFYYIGSRYPERFDPQEKPAGFDLVPPGGGFSDTIIVFGPRASMDPASCSNPYVGINTTKCAEVPGLGAIRTMSTRTEVQQVFDLVVSTITLDPHD